MKREASGDLPTSAAAARMPRAGRRSQDAAVPLQPRPIAVDPFRAFVFPNRVREQRQRAGYPKLMALAAALPEIPYIRLSKIERGEVVARADEVIRIAALLSVAPAALLLDVDAPGFSIARWAEPFLDDAAADQEEERFAVMLAAALRARRQRDRALTLAVLDKQFGLPPVVLSRLENAQKPLGRWNAATTEGLCRLLGARNEAELRRTVLAQYRAGDLDALLPDIANPDVRHARTRERVAALAAELANPAPMADVQPAPPPPTLPQLPRSAAPSEGQARRMLPVVGSPLAGGLIAATPTTAEIEAPAAAGARAFGLRVCRATLGGGLPSHSTVVVDPDRYPAPGGLAVVREGDDYRLLTVTQDRNGVTKGYSVAPDLEIIIDEIDPANLAAVIAASFV